MVKKLRLGGRPSRQIFDHLSSDLRFALRSLGRVPGFTAVALVTLVLGIGAVTTLFSFVYSYAFRPLPYEDADRIVSIEEAFPGYYRQQQISLTAARAVVSASRSFERTTVFQSQRTRGDLRGQPKDLQTLRIDSSFTPMFAIRAKLGRMMTAGEITADAPVVMISDVLWQTTFGSDSSVIGQRQRFGQELLTIVGVMPIGFRYPNQTDLWRPLVRPDTSDVVSLLGKLAHGATRVTLANELTLISGQLARADSQQYFGHRLAATEMIARQFGGSAIPLTAAFVGAAVLVLLIACSNVANLFLVRAAERRGEMAVRAALGAKRGRLIAQTLTESIVLALAAGVLGTFLSMAMTRIILAIIPTSGFPSWLTFGIDVRILLVVIACIAFVTIAVGLAPAREGVRFDLAAALKVGSDHGGAKSGVARTARRGIVVQLALSVVLFVAAALFVRTYQKLAAVDVGYSASQVASLTLFVDPQRLPSDTARLKLATSILDAVHGLGIVRYAAVRGTANTAALSGTQPGAKPDQRMFIDGDTTRVAGRSIHPYPRHMAISNEYFQMLGLRLLRGRGFAPDDRAGSTPVVVISKRYADILWPRDNPIGRTIQFGPMGTRVTVIGVVEDVRDLQGGSAGYSAVPRADTYFSVSQVRGWQFEVLASGTGGMIPLQGAMQDVARRIDPDLVTLTSTLAQPVESALMNTRIFGTLIGVFAVCGLALCVIGIYGIVAYGIAQRTREIGIRIALGGTSEDVIRLMLRQSLRFVVVGLAIGLALSIGGGRLLRVLLFGVSQTDPLTYGVVCLIFGAIAVVACYLPARRVTRVDPLVALRAD